MAAHRVVNLHPVSCLGSTLELTVFCFVFVFFSFAFCLFNFGVGVFRLDSPEGMRDGLHGMSDSESNLRTYEQENWPQSLMKTGFGELAKAVLEILPNDYEGKLAGLTTQLPGLYFCPSLPTPHL